MSDPEIARDDELAKPAVHNIDSLFKKGKGETNKGFLKVKFLGNALKDYQLIRVSGDDSASNEPSLPSFTMARTKLIDSPSLCFYILWWCVFDLSTDFWDECVRFFLIIRSYDQPRTYWIRTAIWQLTPSSSSGGLYVCVFFEEVEQFDKCHTDCHTNAIHCHTHLLCTCF